jgi:hypothetical protein
MRDIKFRHFFSSTKVLTAGHDIQTLILTSTGKEDFWKDAVWMQFTGLKSSDKGGMPIKEAYDGDIIRFYTTEGNEYTKVLSWNEEMKCLMVGNIPYHQLYESGYIQPSELEFEIIGNIFENPELI